MQELFKELKELNLPKGKFAIFGSGPMVIRGLRESEDLDLIVTQDVFDEFKNRGDWNFEIRTCEELQKGNIEMCHEWGPGEWDIDKLINEAEIIDDLPFVRLEEVLKWKKIYNREKDIRDIELIESYFKNQK